MTEAKWMGDPVKGRFGEFGGQYLPESLMPACIELEAAFNDAWFDPAFKTEFNTVLSGYGGRPTPVTVCERLSAELGVKIILNAKTLLTLVHTKSTTSSVRPCWLSAWASRDRRNGRRSTWCSYCHCVCVVWAGLCCLHGRR